MLAPLRLLLITSVLLQVVACGGGGGSTMSGASNTANGTSTEQKLVKYGGSFSVCDENIQQTVTITPLDEQGETAAVSWRYDVYAISGCRGESVGYFEFVNAGQAQYQTTATVSVSLDGATPVPLPVDRITLTVSTGGTGAQGSAAIGGCIDLITRKVCFDDLPLPSNNSSMAWALPSIDGAPKLFFLAPSDVIDFFETFGLGMIQVP